MAQELESGVGPGPEELEQEQEPKTWVCACCEEEMEEKEGEDEYTLHRNSSRCSVGERVCQACYDEMETCDCCGTDLMSDASTHYNEGDLIVCRRCNDRIHTCGSCEYASIDGDDLCVVGDGTYCDGCRPEEDDEGETGPIADNDARVSNSRVRQRPPGTRFFGIEMEVECRDGSDRGYLAEQVMDRWSGDVLVKSDGSLNRGFEVVTVPFEKHEMMVWLEKWGGWLNSSGVRRGLLAWDTGTCGVHVHVSRSSLTPLVISKMDRFIMEPANAGFLEAVAGRGAHAQYAARLLKEKAGARVKQRYGIKIALPENENTCAERYAMLNVGCRDTVEFRLFRGTLNMGRLQMYVQFCDAVCEFCKETGFGELYASPFIAWVLRAQERTRGYRELADRVTMMTGRWTCEKEEVATCV